MEDSFDTNENSGGDRSDIVKLAEDFDHSWGDGGFATIQYLVWSCDRLGFSRRLKLVRQLRAIDSSQHDVQPNNVVHDIIDPSLNARLVSADERRLFQQQWEERRRDEHEEAYAPDIEDSDEYSEHSIPEDKQENHETMQEVRSAYQWVPTQVRCTRMPDGTHKAKFLNNIAGLPDRSICEEVYKSIEVLFTEMLPLLDRLDVVRDTMQVVVKAQEYNLPPQSHYSGRWHREGYSENIAATAVYYLDVSDLTSGGNLSFRPPQSPAPGFTHEEDAWSMFIKDVQASTGTAVAFANTIPHRFRTIHNETNDVQRRLFINFFIVDPSKPLANTTATLPDPFLLRRVLNGFGIREALAQSNILEYCDGYACAPLLHRKLLRDKARAATAADRPHWLNTGHFGNSADLWYTDDYRPFSIDGLTRPLERGVEHSGCNTSDLGSGL